MAMHIIVKTSRQPLRECWVEISCSSSPKTKKCKKAKWLSEEALQIPEKRKEEKGKGERERYT